MIKSKIIKIQESSLFKSDISVIVKLKKDTFWKKDNGWMKVSIMPTSLYENEYEEKIKGSYELMNDLFEKFDKVEAKNAVNRFIKIHYGCK